jgi:hypothetical protein
MDRPKWEVADVFRRYGKTYRNNHGASMSTAQRRVMTAIEVCRTAALGGHLERCDQCGQERNCFNSCRDRHCPKCQSLARAKWIEDRQAELLEVGYFHVVFTVPQEIADIAYQNKELVLGILFRVTAETLRTIAADPKHLGAEIGFFAVLHSWGQNLQFHPHLHCVVSGGGLSRGGERWVSCRRPDFFLPVRVLSSLFQRLFLEALQAAFDARQLRFFHSLESLREPMAFARHLAKATAHDWVVYAKRPFAGPQQVLDYVGRYTHRVAISNNRLVDIEGDQVQFKWKDYRHGDQIKTMTLSAGKRMTAKLKEIAAKLRQRMHEPIGDTLKWLQSVVRGYFQYHAIPGNWQRLTEFRKNVLWLWHRTLRRRSNRTRWTWNRFRTFLVDQIPEVRILHPYPNVRFAAKHPR